MAGTALGSRALRGRESGFFGYVALVGVSALVICAPSLADLPAFLRHAPATFWLLAALAVLGDALPLPLSGRRPLATGGCDAAQGWYHGRPMPADELISWLSRYRPAVPVIRGC